MDKAGFNVNLFSGIIPKESWPLRQKPPELVEGGFCYYGCMRKLIVFIIILGAIFFYFARNSEVPQEKVLPEVSPTPNAENGTFIIEGDSVTLREGVNLDDNLETRLLGFKALGDLNSDGKNDLAVMLTQTGGGSGTFLYLAVHISGPVGYKGTEAIFLGDRVSPQSISASNGVVTVKYLDRKEDEPFAAEPTVLMSKQFTYRDGNLEEK